jgi:hypothetical protein
VRIDQWRPENDKTNSGLIGIMSFQGHGPLLGIILNTGTRLNNRNASLFIYEEPESDLVPPFLVGEIAGSLTLESDRKQLQEFAVALLDWLERTESAGSNVVRNVPFGLVKKA